MKLFTIEENDADQRLDKFLKKLFPWATRSLIYKFNRKDKIKIKFDWSEGKFKKRDNEYKLQVWDEIKIFLSDSEFDILTKNPENTALTPNSSPLGERGRKMVVDKKDIVFEDGHLLVLNKNPGVNVHPWDFKTKELSLITMVHDYLWWKLDSLTFKPSLIHRIDRDTSWIIMIAKKKQILTRLVADLKDHKKIKKTYYALVLWKISSESWTITKKLLRIENAKKTAKV